MNRTTLRRQLLRATSPIGSVREVARTDSAVALTYDDGPQPGGTEAVLEALAEAAVTATFFVLGGRVERSPQLLAEVIAAGHEIALHGPDHVRLTTLPASEVFRRTRDARWRLEDRTGVRVRWFRPPYGAQGLMTWAMIRRAGLEPVVWSHAAFDWLDEPVDRLASRALGGARPGAILLLHDGFPGVADGADDGPPPTFDRRALSRAVLRGLAARGLRAMSVGAAVAEGGPPLRGAWFRA